MSDNKNLANIGIEVKDRLEDKKVVEIVNDVTNIIVKAFPKYNLSYLNIYKILLDTPMYYAKIPDGLSRVNYFYKNSSIYFSEETKAIKIDEFVLHECIHRLQEKKDKKGKIIRIGISEVNELTVKAIALNEGAIQYVVSKALNLPTKQISVYEIEMQSTTDYYPLLTNIISQLAMLLGEEILVDSTINGNEDFKIQIIDSLGENKYNQIEKNLNEILKLKGELVGLKNSNEDIQKKSYDYVKTIKDIYLETQNIIYTSYFFDKLKRAENIVEIIAIKNKLDEYQNLLGKTINNDEFDLFYMDFVNKADRKIEEFQNKGALIVIKQNIFIRILRKIKRLFINSTNEYYK